jgi:pimeloyl-ACP methyl ester carboxylesterase
MIALLDHRGEVAEQHRVRVNGIDLHAVSAGSGQPLLLIHGTPKTHLYWCKVFPLLTRHFRVIAPDVRGAGLSGHPYAEKGHVSASVAGDLVGLLDALGAQDAFVHGEDRGAEYGFVMAALHPKRVRALSFGEMMLSGYGLEERSFMTPENVTDAEKRQGVWEWHVPFFFKADVAEMLISGNERKFWTYWLRSQSFDATALPDDVMEEWISLLSTPTGLRGTLDTYRATLENAAINRGLGHCPVKAPVMTLGASYFFGPLVKESVEATGVASLQNHVFQRCGHSLALEKPNDLAAVLEAFFLRS